MLAAAWSLLPSPLQFAVQAYLCVRFLKFLYIILRSIHIHLLCGPWDMTPLLDSWAVVTGCTDGIGRAYAVQLARTRKWRNFYLIGRSEKKLAAVKDELEQSYGCTVRTCVFDFASDDLERLPAELRTMNIGFLLNCCGIAPDQVGTMAEMPEGMSSKVLRVNLMSAVKMVELILPGMLERDRGAIVNVSSITGWRPIPYICTYPASKAALSFFTDSLSDEFSNTNVKIQYLIPMLVATKVAKYDADEANNIFVVSTETFARQAVRLIGLTHQATGCWQHDVQVAFGTLLSFWLFKKIFVPLVMLGVHKKRVANYVSTHAKTA